MYTLQVTYTCEAIDSLVLKLEPGSGFGISESWIRVWSLEFGVWSVAFRFKGSEFKTQDSGFRSDNLGSRVEV